MPSEALSSKYGALWNDVQGAQCAVPGASYFELDPIGQGAPIGSRSTSSALVPPLPVVHWISGRSRTSPIGHNHGSPASLKTPNSGSSRYSEVRPGAGKGKIIAEQTLRTLPAAVQTRARAKKRRTSDASAGSPFSADPDLAVAGDADPRRRPRSRSPGTFSRAPQSEHPWRELQDEFGRNPEDLQERHYSEFVTFLPYVRRFLYGEGPSRGGNRRAPSRRFEYSVAAISPKSG